MQWILDNWVTVLLIGGFIGVHFFMHGHGGHGGHGGGHSGKKGSEGGDHQRGDDGQTPLTNDNAESEGLSGEIVADNSTNAAGKPRRNSR